MKNILVSDLMTRTPITTKPDTNLLECAKKMVKERVSSLLIIDGKKLAGFVSQKDILWALVKKSKKDLSKIKAIDIAPRKIATISPYHTIRQAVEKMKKSKFERLPVVHNGELVGIITEKDILSFHPELYPELEEFAKIREQEEKLGRIKKAQTASEGICEECGNRDILYKSDGMLMCESCRSR